MRRDKLIKAVLLATLVVFSAGYAYAEDFVARLNGFQEIGALAGPTGAILSNGSATLHLNLHFDKRHVAGGVMVFFCSNLGNGPAGTPACPANSGTVNGTIAAASVVAIATQNVKAGDFDALVDALDSNTAYANIHTTALGAGEIRGQIRRDRRDRHDHDGKDHDR
jgi:hypothetical protein